jgi:hypothetical protein
LYGEVGGRSPAQREQAMLWVLNQSDGSRPLLDIARRSSLEFGIIREATSALEGARLLRPVPEPRDRARKSKSPQGATKRVRRAARKQPRRPGARP